MHQTLAPSDMFEVGSLDETFEFDFDNFDYGDTPQVSPNSSLLNNFIKDYIQNQHEDQHISPECAEELPKRPTSDGVPRHRRNSHVRAEKKRRKKIYEYLRTIQNCVPALRPCRNSKKLSELECLEEAGTHIKERKQHHEARKAEIEQLKQEKETLKMELNQFQEALPSSGLRKGEKAHQTLEDRYAAHRSKRFSEHWEHGVFDRIVGNNLAETYIQHTGNSSAATTYLQSLMKWTDTCLSLSHLRPVVISGLRDLGTNTSFLTNPGQVKQELTSNLQQTTVAPSTTVPPPPPAVRIITTPSATNASATVTRPSVALVTVPITTTGIAGVTTHNTAPSTAATASTTAASPYIFVTTASNTTAVKVAAIAPSKVEAS